MSTIYMSSVHEHGTMWRYHRNLGIPIISSWIDLDGIFRADEIGHNYWPIWIEEAHNASHLIFYATPTDRHQHLHCLLEIGACLAGGGTVIQVGVTDVVKTLDGEYADFVSIDRWHRLTSINDAFVMAQKIDE